MLETPGVHLWLRDPEVDLLTQAIRGHPDAYPDADVTRPSDGISGGLIDPWYLPLSSQRAETSPHATRRADPDDTSPRTRGGRGTPRRRPR